MWGGKGVRFYTCWLSRPLLLGVPQWPLIPGVSTFQSRVAGWQGLVVHNTALGSTAAPPPSPEDVELRRCPRLLLRYGGDQTLGGDLRRWLDEELLALQVEGTTHAFTEAEGGGGAGVTIHGARVEAVRQVSGGVQMLCLGPGTAPHSLKGEARSQETAVRLQLQVQLLAKGLQMEARGGIVTRVALQRRKHQLLVLLRGAPLCALHTQQHCYRSEQQEQCG